MKIDIVCPLYKAEKDIDGFIQKLNMQKDVDIQTVVFPLTRTDGCEKVAEKIENAGYTYFYVEPSDFSHSLTREEAIYLYCTQDIVVMLSQDVVLYDPYALSKLVSMIDEKVVFVYGRQVGKKKTIEEYIRHKNYGLTSYVISGDDVERLQIKAFFSSDAFSAYYRPVFIRLNGYDHADMMMNEDMYYSKKILDSGYCKGYAADAVVEHSHAFSFRQLYARYYETGRWFAEHPEFDEYDAVDSGLKLAFYILKMAIKDINFPVLIRWLPDMAARYLGLKMGRRSK